MARSRNIKPGFFLNDDLASLEPFARILFAGLWCIADREGRLEDKPKRIKIETLPYDDVDINTLLNDLQEAEFIIRYSVDGSNYIQIINFSKHQNPHKNEAESVIPPCSDIAQYKHSTSTVQEQEKYNTNRADSLNLIPDSLNPITTTDSSADDFDPNELESSSRHLFKKFETGFGRTLNGIEADKILFWLESFDPALIEHALEIAVLGGNRSFKYINGILNNWRDKGVKCVQDAQDLERKFAERKKNNISKSNPRAPSETQSPAAIISGKNYEIYIPD